MKNERSNNREVDHGRRSSLTKIIVWLVQTGFAGMHIASMRLHLCLTGRLRYINVASCFVSSVLQQIGSDVKPT